MGGSLWAFEEERNEARQVRANRGKPLTSHTIGISIEAALHAAMPTEAGRVSGTCLSH